MTPTENNQQRAPEPFREEMIWKQLKTVRDPEIPVNIVDLGLIYAVAALPAESGGKRIEVRMTLTAPGCSMSDVIKAEVERKLAALPEVREVKVEIVFDPPWDKSRMSEAAKLHLGFDSDFGAPAPAPGSFKILR
jgi:metal-sulfur cluster biosynthetic enzyme